MSVKGERALCRLKPTDKRVTPRAQPSPPEGGARCTNPCSSKKGGGARSQAWQRTVKTMLCGHILTHYLMTNSSYLANGAHYISTVSVASDACKVMGQECEIGSRLAELRRHALPVCAWEKA